MSNPVPTSTPAQIETVVKLTKQGYKLVKPKKIGGDVILETPTGHEVKVTAAGDVKPGDNKKE